MTSKSKLKMIVRGGNNHEEEKKFFLLIFRLITILKNSHTYRNILVLTNITFLI